MATATKTGPTLCVQTETGRRPCTIGQAYCSCCKNRPTWKEEMVEANAAALKAEAVEFELHGGTEYTPHVARTHPAWKRYLLFVNSRGHVQCPVCNKTLEILPWPEAWQIMEAEERHNSPSRRQED